MIDFMPCNLLTMQSLYGRMDFPDAKFSHQADADHPRLTVL